MLKFMYYGWGLAGGGGRRGEGGAYLYEASVGGVGVAFDADGGVGGEIDGAAEGWEGAAVGLGCELEVLDDDLGGGGSREGEDGDDAEGLHGGGGDDVDVDADEFWISGGGG